MLAATLCVSQVATIREPQNIKLDDLSCSAVPDALVLLNPITDLSAKWGKHLGEKAMALSPLHHISGRTPPTLLIHGNSDQCVSLEDSLAFCKRMTELGRPSKLIVLEGAGHAFGVFKYGPDRFVPETIVAIDDFLVSRDWLTDRRSANTVLLENDFPE